MTRIIAGELRGRALKVPDAGTRPTAERVREAVFSSLTSLDAIAEVSVLDLLQEVVLLELNQFLEGQIIVYL